MERDNGLLPPYEKVAFYEDLAIDVGNSNLANQPYVAGVLNFGADSTIECEELSNNTMTAFNIPRSVGSIKPQTLLFFSFFITLFIICIQQVGGPFQKNHRNSESKISVEGCVLSTSIIVADLSTRWHNKSSTMLSFLFKNCDFTSLCNKQKCDLCFKIHFKINSLNSFCELFTSYHILLNYFFLLES